MLQHKTSSRGCVPLIPVLEFVLPDHQYLDWLPQLFFLFIASELLTDSNKYFKCRCLFIYVLDHFLGRCFSSYL